MTEKRKEADHQQASPPPHTTPSTKTSPTANETPYLKPISLGKTRIGWIGIGVSGYAMAWRLLAAGCSVIIYARSPSKVLSLQSKGATLAASPHDDAKSSDVVFSMVGNPQDVRSIALDNNGILLGLDPGGVFVDTTSSHPALAREIFKAREMRMKGKKNLESKWKRS